jgi:azurin
LTYDLLKFKISTIDISKTVELFGILLSLTGNIPMYPLNFNVVAKFQMTSGVKGHDLSGCFESTIACDISK